MCFVESKQISEIKVRLFVGVGVVHGHFFCTKQENTGRAFTRQMSNNNYISVPPNIKIYSFSFIHNKDPTSTLEKRPVVSRIGGMVKYSGKGRRL